MLHFKNKIKFVLVPFITFLLAFISILFMIMFEFRTVADFQELPYHRIFVGFLETLVLVYIYNFFVRKFNGFMPWKKNWFIRFVLDLLLVLSFTTIVISGAQLAIKFGLIPHEIPHEGKREFMYIMPLFVSSLFLVIVEMIIAMEERNNMEMKLAILEKEQLNTKYSVLKEQLDHHFLFNNLSVLSSLIYESTEKADKFIQDFAAIYRYVLSINKQDLVTVSEELDFISTYLNLYKFRFEEGLSYKLNNIDYKSKFRLPPLTLQVLVENAIKHNVMSRNEPLNIEISMLNNTLIIQNNLQIKSDVASTSTGQSNLIEKYLLLESTPPEFKIENNTYIARIPLIQPKDD
ncbi:sensor histidine kinase [Carboxylicivirga sp. N1Y90]|uniref:sensor histidine kinase n=1 Tax=Carboxylicivirga fragile TaxID=3417571 RepID=UPI003D32C8E6|nr:histidine kinase [Marinilabiliaceae bacterium N1Y90]